VLQSIHILPFTLRFRPICALEQKELNGLVKANTVALKLLLKLRQNYSPVLSLPKDDYWLRNVQGMAEHDLASISCKLHLLVPLNDHSGGDPAERESLVVVGWPFTEHLHISCICLNASVFEKPSASTRAECSCTTQVLS